MLLIKNGHIKTMAGAELEGGSVLIGDDGKIIEVGENLTAPEGCALDVLSCQAFNCLPKLCAQS